MRWPGPSNWPGRAETDQEEMPDVGGPALTDDTKPISFDYQPPSLDLRQSQAPSALAMGRCTFPHSS